MVIFDTDCVIGMLRNDPAAIAAMERFKEDRPCVTSLTIFELLRGVMLSKKPTRERAAVMEAIASFYVIDFGYLDADAAARLDAELTKRGNSIGVIDALIAGICISTKKTLVTRNAKHFERVKGMQVEAW